jgi:DNA-binding NarL/FixJ family response regulator
MPGMNGQEATRRIVAAHDGGIAVVVLTSFSDRNEIIDALDAGASGYLLKDADPEEIVRGTRAAPRGEAPLAPKAARTLDADAVVTVRTPGGGGWGDAE